MRVLLIDRDPEAGRKLQDRLGRDGYVVQLRARLESSEVPVLAHQYTALLLDGDAVDEDVGDLLQQLRAEDPEVLVVVWSVRELVEEKVHVLDSGADDYLAKPVDPDELAARLRASLRRASPPPQEAPPLGGDVLLNPARRTVTRGAEEIALTAREYALLAVLMAVPGRLVTRAQLEQTLYGWKEDVGSNKVEVHIHNLRRKLGEKFIRNVRGRGYRVGGTPEE
jgi:DNA-binding response OmpR family regulator